MHGGIEMKRLLIAFFMMFAVHTAYAENYIVFKSDVVEKAINQLVASENRQSAADEYQKNMDQTNGKISVTGLYKVCIASGFNIQTTDGYNLCRNFLNFMISESDFGTGSVTQQSCINTLNGVWTLSSDGKKYQCIGRDGNLLNYRKSCRDGGGTCIKQFDNLKTQGAKGREFINAYGTLKGLNFTCHANADISKLGQDYIMCSAGGNAYEFEFDSLNQSPDSTSSNSENTAICELYGGKIVNTGDKYTEDTWQSCDISSELCKGVVSSLAQRTGHSVQYQGYCRLSRGIKEVSTIFLNQIDGIDSRIFYNAGLQMRMDTAKPMVEEYLRTKFPNESYIVCGATPKILNEGLGIDKDYVISCTVGSQQVDFIFDDLSETFDNDAATGKEAMQCIINGGIFKGETCRGPTKEECEKLDAVLRSKGSDKGARYDDEARACILGNAESTYKRDVTVGYITGAVVIVGGAVVTIVTGGATAPVVINGAVMLATDIGINYVMDANHQRLTNKAAKKFVNFVTDADACTTEQCALDVLEKHYATLSGVMSDLNTDDQAVVDATMDRLVGLIQTDFVACGEDDNGTVIYASPADCAIQSSHLTVLDYIDPYSEIALVIGSVIFDPGYVVARFTKLNKIAKVADATKDILVKNLNLIENASTLEDAQKYADEARTIFTNFRKQSGVSQETIRKIEKAGKQIDSVLESRQRMLVSSIVSTTSNSLDDQRRAAEDLLKELWRWERSVENATSIEDAEKYAENARQVAIIVRDRVDDLSKTSAELVEKYGKYPGFDFDEKRYSQAIEDIVNKADAEVASVDESLTAMRMNLNAKKQADVNAAFEAEELAAKNAAIAKEAARRTNTSEYITEPVMYFRTVNGNSGKKPEEMVQILKDAGINASLDASDKTAWVINEAQAGGYELVSPFLSPETAPEQFDMVNDLLQKNGVDLVGAVTPTTISQIDPTVATGVSRNQAMTNIREYFDANPELYENLDLSRSATDDELLDALVNKSKREAEEAGNDLYLWTLKSKYSDSDVLMRGQKFATSDASSAYANMSPKAGATGSTLATTDSKYASGFAGTRGSRGGAGDSALYVGQTGTNNTKVGFVNVYQNNDKNVFYGNVDIERMSDVTPTSVSLKGDWNNETLITPQDNPIVERYMVTAKRNSFDETFIPLDVNNTEHKLIMDAFAPDLSKTYNEPMLQRIESVKSGMTDGTVQTYDFVPVGTVAAPAN